MPVARGGLGFGLARRRRTCTQRVRTPGRLSNSSHDNHLRCCSYGLPLALPLDPSLLATLLLDPGTFSADGTGVRIALALRVASEEEANAVAASLAGTHAQAQLQQQKGKAGTNTAAQAFGAGTTLLMCHLVYHSFV